MNYTLCKKLKDAGFPQRRGCPSCLVGYSFDCSIDPTPIDSIMNTVDQWIARPTLSELIRIIGNKFGSLTKIESDTGITWIAEPSPNFYNLANEQTDFNPEVAVAKLWLELNRCKLT